MMYFFGDDTGFSTTKSTTHNVFMFGGFVIEDKGLRRLQTKIESVKGKYIDSRVPVKWNLRGLKTEMIKLGLEHAVEKLLKHADPIREEIIESIADIDYKIIVSAVQDTSEIQKLQTARIEELERYAFTYCLGQLCRYVYPKKHHAQVVLDWPTGGNSKPFSQEYAYAYTQGKSISGKYEYPWGPLRKMNFMDSPFFAKSMHSTYIQLADIFVGITKDWIESKINPNKTNQLGTMLYPVIKSKFAEFDNSGEQGPYIPKQSHMLRNAVYPLFEDFDNEVKLDF